MTLQNALRTHLAAYRYSLPFTPVELRYVAQATLGKPVAIADVEAAMKAGEREGWAQWDGELEGWSWREKEVRGLFA